MNKANIDMQKCIGCGNCVDACPRGCIEIVDGRAQIKEADCVGCMVCERVCPEDAISLIVKAEIIQESEQVENRTSFERSESTPLIKSSTVRKVGKFLLNSSLALLSSPRVWRAILGRNGSGGGQGKSGGISTCGRGSGKGRGRNRQRRGRTI